ncbi:unnamed protein product [Lepidochelys olivacea]
MECFSPLPLTHQGPIPGPSPTPAFLFPPTKHLFFFSHVQAQTGSFQHGGWVKRRSNKSPVSVIPSASPPGLRIQEASLVVSSETQPNRSSIKNSPFSCTTPTPPISRTLTFGGILPLQ